MHVYTQILGLIFNSIDMNMDAYSIALKSQFIQFKNMFVDIYVHIDAIITVHVECDLVY